MFRTPPADPFGDLLPVRESRPDTRAAWRDFTRTGICENCGKRRQRTAHHVLLEQMVHRAGGNIWAVRNRMLICWPCQVAHHAGGPGRIPFEKVPQDAVRFAVALIGDTAAGRYFLRRYG